MKFHNKLSFGVYLMNNITKSDYENELITSDQIDSMSNKFKRDHILESILKQDHRIFCCELKCLLSNNIILIYYYFFI